MSKRVEGERTSIRWVDGYLWVVEQREDNELWVPQKGFLIVAKRGIIAGESVG